MLTVGDVVILEDGDFVPADIRLFEVINLKVEESGLTGESLAVEKNTEKIEGTVGIGDIKNTVFSSSLVTYGRAKGYVIAVGMQTEVGKIAQMINEVQDKQTPLKKKLNSLGKTLAFLASIICVIIFFIGISTGKSVLSMLITAISLAVAAIPEGLPAVATIVQAMGVKKLVSKNAIVKKMPAVETLGSATIICSDKTGTLTQNKMTVVDTYVVEKDNEEQFLGRINRSCKKSGKAYFFYLTDAKKVYKNSVIIENKLNLFSDEMRDVLENKNFDVFYSKVLEILKRKAKEKNLNNKEKKKEIVLNEEQQEVYDKFKSIVKEEVFSEELLYGVTGSRKNRDIFKNNQRCT